MERVSSRGPRSRRAGRRLRGPAAQAARRLRRPRLSGAEAAPPAERTVAAASARRACRAADRADSAINDVLFHAPERRILQDVVTCIRRRYHRRAGLPARAPCRSPPEIACDGGAAVPPPSRGDRAQPRDRRTLLLLARRAGLPVPHEAAEPRLTPQQTLERLTWEGAAAR